MNEDLFRKGQILKFFAQSGYGFIKDEKGKQVYFHMDEVRVVGEPRHKNQIREGMQVGFDVSRTSKGERATHMVFYSPAPIPVKKEKGAHRPPNESVSNHDESNKETGQKSTAPSRVELIEKGTGVLQPSQGVLHESHPPDKKPD